MAHDPSGAQNRPASGDPAAAATDEALRSAGEQGERTELEARVESLESELRESQDRFLRSQADLENFRKRTRREAEEQVRYAALPLVRDLLSVIDNLNLAVQAADQSQGGAGLLEGVKMVAAQLSGILEQHQCRQVDATPGNSFDPHRHEALGQEPSAYPAGQVSRVVRPGYQLHDRVIRPAQVLLSAGSPAA